MISRAIEVGVGIVFRVVRVVRGRGRDTMVMLGIGVGRIVRGRGMADRVGLWIGVGIICRVTGVIPRGGCRDRKGIITGRTTIIWARVTTGGVGGARVIVVEFRVGVGISSASIGGVVVGLRLELGGPV